MCTNYIKLEITTKGKATKYTRVDMILYSISGYTCFILRNQYYHCNIAVIVHCLHI